VAVRLNHYDHVGKAVTDGEGRYHHILRYEDYTVTPHLQGFVFHPKSIVVFARDGGNIKVGETFSTEHAVSDSDAWVVKTDVNGNES
jgi:hypothetical protein